MVDVLESLCDEHNADLPELRSFVLPGGTETAARLHVARTVARRAELAALEADVNPLARVYLNRVSDLLFILAREANRLAGRDEPLWRPGDATA
jgi:cob(I)alamin adenosyltransferase